MIDYISTLPGKNLPFPRRVALMGSTGSIGGSTLSVIAANPESFSVIALAAGKNTDLLAKQAAIWRPPHLGVLDEERRKDLLCRLAPLEKEGYTPEIHVGPAGYSAIAALSEADIVLSAQVGAAGLAATYAAACAGKTIALSNKESLVLAGALIRKEAHRNGALILPVDSEHNALFQCLAGQDNKALSHLILTASGGPFRGKDAAFLRSVTPKMALAHPNWSMGAKITIDSATMMNKGLEVIEACHLYGLPQEKVKVLVHPQSIVHSMVAFTDASIIAQLGPPDMRMAISHCLGWPERIASAVPEMDLAKSAALSFEEADSKLFRCLDLAREAFRFGKGMPVVLNAANEIAVAAFLSGRLAFIAIAETVEKAMAAHAAGSGISSEPTLEEIIDLDQKTREIATQFLS